MNEQNSHQSPPQGGKGVLGQIENFFDEYLVRKAPFHLPDNVKEVIVKVAPWITIILMVLAIPLILAAIGFTVAFAPAAVVAGHSLGTVYWIGWVITLASLILEIMSIKGLLHRQMQGWRYVYWAMLLGVLSNILMVSIGGLVGNLIGLYILFQVKSKYH